MVNPLESQKTDADPRVLASEELRNIAEAKKLDAETREIYQRRKTWISPRFVFEALVAGVIAAGLLAAWGIGYLQPLLTKKQELAELQSQNDKEEARQKQLINSMIAFQLQSEKSRLEVETERLEIDKLALEKEAENLEKDKNALESNRVRLMGEIEVWRTQYKKQSAELEKSIELSERGSQEQKRLQRLLQESKENSRRLEDQSKIIATLGKDSTWLIAIGVDKYNTMLGKIDGAVVSAETFLQVANRNNYANNPEVLVNASLEDVEKQLDGLRISARESDPFVLYFSGRIESRRNKFWLQLRDSQPRSGLELSAQEVGANAEKQLWIIDGCLGLMDSAQPFFRQQADREANQAIEDFSTHNSSTLANYIVSIRGCYDEKSSLGSLLAMAVDNPETDANMDGSIDSGEILNSVLKVRPNILAKGDLSILQIGK